jgi:hypothetical protein
MAVAANPRAMRLLISITALEEKGGGTRSRAREWFRAWGEAELQFIPPEAKYFRRKLFDL